MLDRLVEAASFCRRMVARLGTLMGYVAGWGFILCSVFITFDVLARRFAGFSSQATTELTGYTLAFGISWGLAHALSMRAHIRIDVLINYLPDRLRYLMHLLSLIALAVFMASSPRVRGIWSMSRSCSARPTSACCKRRCGSRKACGPSASWCFSS
jgi:TRAP-type mannitol/chloroaromatic compound transport system permease small subunit